MVFILYLNIIQISNANFNPIHIFECRCSVGVLSQKSEHITPLLRELHWLRVPECIQFWLCVLVHRCLHGSALAYFAESLHRITEVSAHRCLQSVDNLSLIIPSTRCSTLGVIGYSLWQRPGPGTVCPTQWKTSSPCKVFARNSSHCRLTKLLPTNRWYSC